MKKKKQRRFQVIECLEPRQLLSAAVQLVAEPPASNSTQVQAVDLAPTYTRFIPAGALTPLQTSGPQGFMPADLRGAYGMTQVTFGAVAGDGTGQTIAIIDAYNYPTAAADLHAFSVAAGLPDATLKVVSQTGSTTKLPSVDPAGAGNSDWEMEEALDIEWAHAMAPGASIILVEANDSSPGNLFAAANWARQQAGVSVVSMSFGGNELASQTSYDSIFTTPAGHNGVTFVASTGDSGTPAGYPAYSPNVVAIGGTALTLNSAGAYASETGWSGSGGGISTVESQPSYQQGVVTQSGSFRTAPDVSFDASPNTGVAVYDSYDNGNSTPWEVIGGTSLAAPSWAGIIAVADQGRALASEGTLDGRTGTLPLLYSAPVSLFHDVTTGNNGYAAKAGYDLVTGRGTPKLNLLIPYLVSGAVPPPPVQTGPSVDSITASALTVTEGDTLTLTANNVSDPGANGVAVTIYEEYNSVPGLQTDPTTGDYSFGAITDGTNELQLDTTGVTGTFTFYVQVTDASGGATPVGLNAQSVTVNVVAPNTNGPSIGSITATPNPATTGDIVTLNVNNLSDSVSSIRRVYYYEETNGIPGLQTGTGGDYAFRATTALSGFSIDLDTTGVTGLVTFYAQALDYAGNVTPSGTSAPSVDVNISSNTPPDVPTNLVATAASASEIDLTFAETASNQTGFTLERSPDPNFTSVTQLLTINRPDAVNYSDTGLTAGTNYYYRVAAFNGAGTSDFSNEAHAKTLAASTVKVSSTANASTYGHAVTFTAKVSAGSGVPNGTVQFQIDGNDFGVPENLLDGAAVSADISTLTAGNHTITATYSGNAALSIGTGNLVQKVNKSPLVVTVASLTTTYGNVLPVLTGVLTGVLAGDGITANYVTTATQFSDVGKVAITATLNDPNTMLSNYSVKINPGTLTIIKANQQIIWAAPAPIVHGTALSATQLDATVSGVLGGAAPGLLTYSPGLGSIQGTGVRTLKVTAAATKDYNAAKSAVVLTVTPAINLTASVGAVKPVLATYKTGTSFVLPLTIKNIGLDSAPASALIPIVVDIRFSTDGTYDSGPTGDIEAIQVMLTSSIGKGGTVTRNITVPIPLTLAPGDYFVVVMADSTGVIAETNEADNFTSTIETITVTN